MSTSIAVIVAASAAAYLGHSRGGLAILGAFVCLRAVRFALGDCDVTLAGCGVRAAELKGRVVWVTGASSGIGEGLAMELAKHGAVVVLSARREAELQRVAAACGASTVVVPMDVANEASRVAGVEAVYKRLGKVDILINNAGISQRALAADVSESAERSLFEVNYFGTVALTKLVVKRMRGNGGGRIAVISSVAGKVPAPVSASYSATKHAVNGFFGALRIEEAPNNIGVTVICPGPVVSEVARNALGADGKPLGPRDNEYAGKMPTARCCYLCVAGISNGLEEMWISEQPYLLYTYIAQYMPTIFIRIAKKFGQKRVSAVRAGKGNINE